jgi:hypothetical protein
VSYGRASKRPTLALQSMRLLALGLPSARVRIPAGARLTYHFDVCPFPGARTYHCLITLERNGGAPNAYVLSPNLKALADGKRLPHVYKHAGSSTLLCLYLPGSGEWNSNKFLADTFVPWTVEWLKFFELWLVDGEWRGGGRHPGDADELPAGKEPASQASD